MMVPMNAEFIGSAYKKTQYPASNLPEIAFAGRSNVGKSSLINVLVNRKKLARISSTPGRTRSINFFKVNSAFLLVDLPGYGFARVPDKVRQSWRQMVETYLHTRDTLRAVVVILDIRRDLSHGDMNLLKWLFHFGVPPIVVLTKADKISRRQAHKRHARITAALVKAGVLPETDTSSPTPVIFSARTRQGRDDILRRIHTAADLNAGVPSAQNSL